MKENRKRSVLSILTAGAAAVSLLLAAGSFAQAGCIRLEQEPRSVAADVGQMADEAVQKGAAAKITLAETEETMRSAAKVQLQSREKIRQMEEERARIRAEEQELLAALIFCEAGNQPYEGQVAVGAVVMNRIRSGSYPDTVREVIYQPGQFTPAMTGWLDQVLAGKGYTESAMQAAGDALLGVDPVEGCLYFGCGGYGKKIGDHYFH